MKEIQITKGYVTQVDDKHYELLSKSKWQANVREASNTVYVQCSMPAPTGSKRRQVTVCMHRFIMNVPDGFQVDHIDGNGLNNQESNLRIVTQQQNLCNQTKYSNNTSGYKGVSFDNNCKFKPWAANIQANGKTKKIGRFATKNQAAEAYNKAALELHGEFANLNVIEESN